MLPCHQRGPHASSADATTHTRKWPVSDGWSDIDVHFFLFLFSPFPLRTRARIHTHSFKRWQGCAVELFAADASERHRSQTVGSRWGKIVEPRPRNFRTLINEEWVFGGWLSRVPAASHAHAPGAARDKRRHDGDVLYGVLYSVRSTSFSNLGATTPSQLSKVGCVGNMRVRMNKDNHVFCENWYPK